MVLYVRNSTIFYSLLLNDSIFISKVTTTPILINNNPSAIWGEGKTIQNLIFSHSIESIQILMKDWVILTLNKSAYLKMAKVENDLDIYYAVGNANTQRQESEISVIINKRNSAGWKLISTSVAIVDNKNNFSNLYLFWEKG